MKSTIRPIHVFSQCFLRLMGSCSQRTESSGWARLELISTKLSPIASLDGGSRSLDLLWLMISLLPHSSFTISVTLPNPLSPTPTLHPSTHPIFILPPPIPISLPFVIISQLIFALSRSQEQVVLTHQGVGPLTFQRPLQTCNAPFALHCSLFLPTLPFSAVDERHQLEETERNGPNYSIGNWKLAN